MDRMTAMAAFWTLDEQTGKQPKLAVMLSDGGQASRVLAIPLTVNFDAGLSWAPDGRAVTYIDNKDGV